MICPNCKNDNKNTNIRCDFCSARLNYVDVNDYLNEYKNLETKKVNISSKKVGCLGGIISLIFFGPMLLIGILFIGIGLYSSISVHNETKGYEKTTGILKDYENCYYDDGRELCGAKYEYQVNGVTYFSSSSTISSKDGFNESETVYYNPSNPSESVIYADWNHFISVGFLFATVPILFLIIFLGVIKKISNGKDNIMIEVFKRK